MRLIQISDCHLLADNNKTSYQGINPFFTLAHTLQLAARLSPDQVIVTGDISGDDSAQSYQWFLALLEQELSGIKVCVIPGNHDSNPHFNALLGHLWLTPENPLELGSWVLHGIDTRYQGTVGMIDTAQLAQVGNKIEAMAQSQHIVALHHHPVATQSWMDTHRLLHVDVLQRFCEQYPALKLLIHGHIHSATKTEFYGADVLSAPSTCWQWALNDEFGVADESAGLRVIDVTADHWCSSIRRIE